MSTRTFIAVAACVAASLIAASTAGGGGSAEAGTRAAGVVGYLLLWAAVETGLWVHLHLRVPRVTAAGMMEAHRTFAALGFAFILGHVWGLLVDPVSEIGAVEVFVPFAPVDHMVARTAGSLGFWATLVALSASALIGRIPYGLWRRTHLLTFPAFFLSLLHGLLAGSHFTVGPWTAFYLGTAALVVVTVAGRAAGRHPAPRLAARPAPHPIAPSHMVSSRALRLRGQRSSRALESLWLDLERGTIPAKRERTGAGP